jgi:hypothetical protein
MRVAWLARRPKYGSQYKYAEMFKRVCDLDVLHQPYDDLSGYDAFICEGDDPTRFSIPKKPYILVAHDVASVRKDDATMRVKERTMYRHARAVLFNSEPLMHLTAQVHDLENVSLVGLRPLLRDLDFDPLPKQDRSIVYAGGILGKTRHGTTFGYRVYHDIFKRLSSAGWTVHIYLAWGRAKRSFMTEYERLGCKVHDCIPQGALYREMSQYTMGFQGYGRKHPYVAYCTPNKTWEYLGAGIPTLGYNTGAAGPIYNGKWGLVSGRIAELAERAEQAALIDVEPYRTEEVMDSDIDTFRELVECLR